jgi:hypothetical protein
MPPDRNSTMPEALLIRHSRARPRAGHLRLQEVDGPNNPGHGVVFLMPFRVCRRVAERQCAMSAPHPDPLPASGEREVRAAAGPLQKSRDNRSRGASALCVLRDAPSRALLSMTGIVHGINEVRHPEEAAPSRRHLRRLLRTRRPSRRTHEAQSGHPSICAGMRGRGSFIFQPKREVLLQICCRCSHWQQSVQFMIAGSSTPTGPLG